MSKKKSPRKQVKVNAHKEVPAGEWVDVHKGWMMAPGTYIDSAGVLRDVGDDSCVVWHRKGCERKGIQPHEIVYDPETNAPWCPLCWGTQQMAKAIKEVFEK